MKPGLSLLDTRDRPLEGSDRVKTDPLLSRLLRKDSVFKVAPRDVIKRMHLGAGIGVVMGVGVGQASGVFDTPHGIESASRKLPSLRSPKSHRKT